LISCKELTRMHILPTPDAPAETPAPIPFLIVPRDLGDRVAGLSRDGGVLYLNPTASRDELLVAIEEAAVYLRTGDPGSARRGRHLHTVEVTA
jgi:hypothetical protein